MFKIAIDETAEKIEELKELERVLVRETNSITEAEEELRKVELAEQCRCLERVAEELFERRKEVYELIVSLEKIRKVYEKQDKKILEMLETSHCRHLREGAWVTIEFPAWEMELISYIKA